VRASAVSPGQTGKDEEMKAFAVDELGGPGSLHEVPLPEPAQGQLRLRVAASGLNPFDVAVAQGYMKDRMEHRFPLVPGMDASGTVDALGEGVSEWSVGEDAFGSVGKPYLGEGTLAEFVAVSTGTVARKPSSLDHTVAASIPTAGVTAMIMADALQLSKGQTAVAIGATGGVGSYFVQLATRRGVRVVAISRAENAEYARSLGAADVVDYTADDVAAAIRKRFPDGIDAVADMHGDREQVAGLAEQVRSGGHVASAVGAADVDALKARGVEATNVVGLVTTASLETLAGMLTDGEIVAPEIHPYPLAGAAEALATVGGTHVRGKVVLVP
jgi:NADPH2:quinone reductase